MSPCVLTVIDVILHHRGLRAVSVLVLYVTIAVGVIQPRPQTLGSTLPVGPNPVATVPLFNAWTIWWNADRAAHGFREYWTAPIFHPQPLTFAFSEPQPATMLVAPVIWLTGSRVLAYKAYLGFSLLLNGVFTVLLLRSLGRGFAAAVLGGAAMMLLPIVHQQIDVLQLIPLWGILWTWHALRRLCRRPQLRRGLETGLAFGCSFLMSIHHGLFLAVLLMGTFWVLPRRWKSPRLIAAGLTAACVALLLVGPLAVPIRSAARDNDFTRSKELVARLSAQPVQYVTPPKTAWIQLGPRQMGPSLSPGWLLISLAVVGLACGVLRRGRRRWTLFLAWTGLLAFLLSLGPNLKLGDWQPWWILAEWLPGFAQVRSVFRFAYFVQIVIVLLAMEGLQILFILQRRFTQGGRPRRLAGGAVIGIGIAAVCESWPGPPPIAGVPDAAANRGWIEFVRDHTPPDRAIACIPFAAGDSVSDFHVTTRWMYYGTFHGVPLVNGYSGFFPPEYFALRDVVNETFPDEEALLRLAEAKVEFVVVRRSAVSNEALDAAKFEAVSLEEVFSDRSGINVYRLRRPE